MAKRSETYTFEEAQRRLLDEFEAILEDNDLEVKVGSHLERMCLNVMQAVDVHQRKTDDIGDVDFRTWCREILGMNNLVALLVRVRGHKSFSQVVPHLSLLNKGSPAQNTPSLLDDASNKLFELVVACAAMRMVDNGVNLDDPVHSSGGTNPDVMFPWGGKTVAVACKVPTSSTPKSIADNVEKAIQQIDASPADVGIVALNLKNILDHDVFMPIVNMEDVKAGEEPLYGALGSKEEVTLLVAGAVDDLLDDLRVPPLSTQLHITFGASSKAMNGVVFYLHTSAYLKASWRSLARAMARGLRNFTLRASLSSWWDTWRATRGRPVMMTFVVLKVYEYGQLTKEDLELLRAVNRELQVA